MITWSVAKPHEIGALSRWVADLIWPGRSRDFGNCQGLAVMENDVLIAGMIYHNFEPDAGVVEISGAGTSKRWLTKETLRILFQIPFKDWECQAVVMRISDRDPTLQSILKRYGFEQYVIPRLRGRDENENVFVLTDDAWRSDNMRQTARREAEMRRREANGQAVRSKAR